MFNIQPGQGLGFDASREIVFGLGYILFIYAGERKIFTVIARQKGFNVDSRQRTFTAITRRKTFTAIK